MADKDIAAFKVAYAYLVKDRYAPIQEGIVYTTCPKCGYGKAVKKQLQSRSLDEEATTVIECERCSAGSK